MPTRTPAPTVTPAPTPADSQSDMRAYVLAALHSLSELPHRLESKIVFTDGTTVITTIEYAPPGNKHLFYPDGEMIVVDNKVYNRAKGEEWRESPMDATQISYPDMGIGNLDDIQFLGQEDLDGTPSLIYEASVFDETTDATSVMTFWIGQHDSLLYKVVNDGQVGSLDADTGNMKIVEAVSTNTFSYDPSIEITAPIG